MYAFSAHRLHRPQAEAFDLTRSKGFVASRSLCVRRSRIIVSVSGAGGGGGGNGTRSRGLTSDGESDDSPSGLPSHLISSIVALVACGLTFCEPALSHVTKRKPKPKSLLPETSIQGLFDMLDLDGSGTITIDELVAAVKSGGLGLLHSEKGISSFMLVADKDASGAISYQEFQSYIRQREAELSALFDIVDQDGSGAIDVKELHQYMDRALERKVSFAEAQALLSRLDSNKNGMVEYEELLHGTLLSAGSIWKVLEAESLYYFLPKKDPSLRIFLSGFIAGAVSRTLTAPFDRASILMRAGGSALAKSTVFGTLGAMAKEGGLKSWWSGNGLLCLTVAPESAFMFSCYNALRPLMSNPDEPTIADKLLAGGAAGLAAMTAVYPLYASQARMALAPNGSFTSLRNFFSKTVAAEGWVAFGRGYIPSALRAFPSRGLDLMVYSTLKEIFAPGETVTIPQSLAFGALAGIISQSATMPLLTLRTRMAGQAPSLGRPILYRNMIDCVRKTVSGDAALGLAAGGLPALYRGLPALLMKMIPCTGIQFASFELANKFLSRYLD